MDRKAAKNLLIDFLKNKLYAYAGLRQADNMSTKQVVEWADIMEDAYHQKSWMNIGRLENILVKGMSGDYGDFPNLNKKVLMSWISSFYKDHQNEIDSEMREKATHTKSHKESEINYWYEQGIKRFKELYTQTMSKYLSNPLDDISYLSIDENIDRGEIWWKVFEEAGLVSFDPQENADLIKLSRFRLEREANSSKEFTVNVPDASIHSHVKSILLRKELAKYIMQEEKIEDIFKEFNLLEIRKRNFFSVLV